MNKAQNLLNAFRKNASKLNGFTMDSNGNLVNPVSGYAVAYQEAPLTLEGLEKALEANPDLYLGYWQDEKGIGYTDLVRIIQDRTTAIKAGLMDNQKAIWSFEEHREIWL